MNSVQDWQSVEAGVRRRITLNGERLMFVEVHFEPGAIGATHHHIHEQATYVLQGRVKFTLNSQETIVSAGETLHIPSNTVHGAEALEESLLLDVFSPPREDFLNY